MSSENSTLGDRLVQTIAERIAAQSALRQQIHQQAAQALEQFLKHREEAHEKLMARLDKLSTPPAPDPRFKLFWSSHQKHINRQLWQAHQQLAELLRSMLKEEKKSHRETARLLKMVATPSDATLPDDDAA